MTTFTKKVIHSSNLALRFYERDGWSKVELDEVCIRGEVKCFHHDPDRYFILDYHRGSIFDIPKLLEKASKVVRTFDDYPDESDESFCKRFNW